MKNLKRMLMLFLAAICFCGGLVLPVSAESTVVKSDNLEVAIEMDKEQYEPGEPITATITVRNISTTTVTIANLEQLIPDGYHLAESSKASLQNIELHPEQTTTLKVTFAGEGEQPETTAEGFVDKVLYGETWGIPNLLIVVLLVIAFVVFMILT